MIIMEDIKRSGVTGVLWVRSSKKWSVGITLHKRKIHLGLFKEEDLDIAVMTRYMGEQLYHQEYDYEPTLAYKYLKTRNLI